MIKIVLVFKSGVLYTNSRRFFMTIYNLFESTSAPATVLNHLVYNESISHTWTLENGYLSVSNFRLLIVTEDTCLSVPHSTLRLVLNSPTQLDIYTDVHYMFSCNDESLLLQVEKSIFTHLFNKQD